MCGAAIVPAGAENDPFRAQDAARYDQKTNGTRTSANTGIQICLSRVTSARMPCGVSRYGTECDHPGHAISARDLPYQLELET